MLLELDKSSSSQGGSAVDDHDDKDEVMEDPHEMGRAACTEWDEPSVIEKGFHAQRRNVA
jgi:hypothetical protein